MTLTVVWLVIGIPALALGLGLLVPRRQALTLLGYVVLAAGFGIVTAYDPVSGAVVGMALALLYATGRGQGEREGPASREPGVPDVVAKPERAA
jgi:hypothetical protein